MARAQQARYLELLNEYMIRGEVTSELKSLMKTLACIEVEEDNLQAYINKHGTCYTAPSGHNKQRPEWQQLRDNRQRKTAIVTALNRAYPTSQKLVEDENAEFFG